MLKPSLDTCGILGGSQCKPWSEHIGAQVLGKSCVCAPGLPSLVPGSVLKAGYLCWDQTHTHCPEVALGLELRTVLGHLKDTGVRGKVVVHGVLPALTVVPQEGDHHLT